MAPPEDPSRISSDDIDASLALNTGVNQGAPLPPIEPTSETGFAQSGNRDTPPSMQLADGSTLAGISNRKPPLPPRGDSPMPTTSSTRGAPSQPIPTRGATFTRIAKSMAPVAPTAVTPMVKLTPIRNGRSPLQPIPTDETTFAQNINPRMPVPPTGITPLMTNHGPPLPVMEPTSRSHFSPFKIFKPPRLPGANKKETLPSFGAFLKMTGLADARSYHGLRRPANSAPLERFASMALDADRAGVARDAKQPAHSGVGTMRPGSSASSNSRVINPVLYNPSASTETRHVGTSLTSPRTVIAILQHKQENDSFRFLTRFLGPFLQWAPTRRFITPDGIVDAVWLKYVIEEGLFRNNVFVNEYRQMKP